MVLEQKAKPYESIYSNRLFRAAGNALASLLIKMQFSASAVTYMNIILEIAAALVFLGGDRSFLITGAVLMFISHTLDYADGSIARWTQSCSRCGEWLDETGDKIAEPFVYIGLLIGQFYIYEDVSIWFWGSIAIAARMGTIILVANTERFTGKDRVVIKSEVSSHFIKKAFMFNKSNTVLLLFVACIINKIYAFFVFTAIYGTVFNFLSFMYLASRIKSLPEPKPEGGNND